MRKYKIEVNEEQAKAISIACEIGARIGMYQLHDICRLLPYISDEDKQKQEEIYKKFWDMYLKYSREMNNYQKPEISNILWDIYQVIRHRIAWDNEPDSSPIKGVCFDKPFKTSECDLATIDVIS